MRDISIYLPFIYLDVDGSIHIYIRQFGRVAPHINEWKMGSCSLNLLEDGKKGADDARKIDKTKEPIQSPPQHLIRICTCMVSQVTKGKKNETPAGRETRKFKSLTFLRMFRVEQGNA